MFSKKNKKTKNLKNGEKSGPEPPFIHTTNLYLQFMSPIFRTCSFFRGEWPNGLKHYIQNREDPGSNPTRCSASFRTQRCYKAPPGDPRVQITIHPNTVINIGLVRLLPQQWPKVYHGAAKQKLKNTFSLGTVIVLYGQLIYQHSTKPMEAISCIIRILK